MTDADPRFQMYDGPQPDFGRWLRESAHNLTGLVPSMCEHGARFLVVEADDVPPGAVVGGQLEDGRVLLGPRPGTTWVRAKYMTGNMTCIGEQGQPIPADLATPALNRPVPALHPTPVRMWAPEPYDPAVHGQPVTPDEQAQV